MDSWRDVRQTAGEREADGAEVTVRVLLAQVADWQWAMDAEFRIVQAQPLASGRLLSPLPALIGYRP